MMDHQHADSQIDYANPNPELISLIDIAQGLARSCRFMGMTSEFHSVATHCVDVSLLVPKEFALYGLLHDASEAFLRDIPTPLKKLLPDYRAIEDAWSDMIFKKFGLQPPSEAVQAALKEADLAVLAAERKRLMPNDKKIWPTLKDVQPAQLVVEPRNPDQAFTYFLARWTSIVEDRPFLENLEMWQRQENLALKKNGERVIEHQQPSPKPGVFLPGRVMGTDKKEFVIPNRATADAVSSPSRPLSSRAHEGNQNEEISDTSAQCLSGNYIDFARPHVDQFTIDDVAQALSRESMHLAATRSFYTVAQHRVLVALLVKKDAAPYALFHNAAEAFFRSLPASLKRMLPDYRAMHDKMQVVVYEKVGLAPPSKEITQEIEQAELSLLAAERTQLISGDRRIWPGLAGIEPANIQIDPWSPNKAHTAFIDCYLSVFNNRPYLQDLDLWVKQDSEANADPAARRISPLRPRQ